MARIAYDDGSAAAFAATRHLSAEERAGWRTAVALHLATPAGTRLLDLGDQPIEVRAAPVNLRLGKVSAGPGR